MLNKLSPKTPPADEVHFLKGVLPIFQEMLDYCGLAALGEEKGLSYDASTDQVIYHLNIREDDRELFPWLRPVEEIWILQKGGVDQ